MQHATTVKRLTGKRYDELLCCDHNKNKLCGCSAHRLPCTATVPPILPRWQAEYPFRQRQARNALSSTRAMRAVQDEKCSNVGQKHQNCLLNGF
eukprot:scaffold10974_cov37-Tisochrysis_lutea.AAC.3